MRGSWNRPINFLFSDQPRNYTRLPFSRGINNNRIAGSPLLTWNRERGNNLIWQSIVRNGETVEGGRNIACVLRNATRAIDRPAEGSIYFTEMSRVIDYSPHTFHLRNFSLLFHAHECV